MDPANSEIPMLARSQKQNLDHLLEYKFCRAMEPARDLALAVHRFFWINRLAMRQARLLSTIILDAVDCTEKTIMVEAETESVSLVRFF